MAISNYTTKVAASKTVGDLTMLLARHNANKVMTEFAEGIPVALNFQIETPNGILLFQLPANAEGVLAAMLKDKQVPRSFCTKQQSVRVAWRILLYWTEAQMAMVEAQLAAVDQVFMPYALLHGGKTVYQYAIENNFLQLGP